MYLHESPCASDIRIDQNWLELSISDTYWLTTRVNFSVVITFKIFFLFIPYDATARQTAYVNLLRKVKGDVLTMGIFSRINYIQLNLTHLTVKISFTAFNCVPLPRSLLSWNWFNGHQLLSTAAFFLLLSSFLFFL